MKNFVLYKNTKVAYKIIGNGETYCLFLHGWACTSSVWENASEALKNNFTCICVDFPPFGESGELTSPWTLQDYTDCILEILKKCDVQSYHIVCHSFGCRVAINLCLQDSKVQKLVITGGAGIKNQNIKIKLSIHLFKIKKFLAKLHLYPSKKLEGKGSKDYAVLSPVMKKTFSNVVNTDQKKLLKQIKNETLLLWGKYDEQTPLKNAYTMKKYIKNSSLYVYTFGDHFAFLSFSKSFCNVIKIFLIEE